MDVHPRVGPDGHPLPEPWPLGSAQADVRRFHELTDLPVRDFPPRDGYVIPRATIMLRARLIHEEMKETLEGLGAYIDPEDGEVYAAGKPDIVKVADGIADSIFVLLGTAVSLGINIAPVWREVQRSNMTKIDPVTGKAIKRSDGKILKPATFSKADVSGEIEHQVIAGELDELSKQGGPEAGGAHARR